MIMKSNLKFLYSYGGKMLARPFDGQVRYVGGATRIISIPRDITFQELKKKLAGDTDMVALKYQLIPGGDLDDDGALVSVACDEDLRYMMEMHDHRSRVASADAARGRARLMRVFLFPSGPDPLRFKASDQAHAALDHHYIDWFGDYLKQLYVDAINGAVRCYSYSSSSSFTRENRSSLSAGDGEAELGLLGDAYGPFSPRGPLFSNIW